MVGTLRFHASFTLRFCGVLSYTVVIVEKYWNIIREFEIDIIPLTKEDVELSSKLCRSKNRIRDYFIGATVVNRNGNLLTYNVNDFKWTKRAYIPEDFVKHYNLKSNY